MTGYPWQYGDFGIINANCPDGYSKSDSGKPEEIDEAFIEEFLDYQLNGVVTESLLQKFKDAFSQVAQ